MYEVSLTNANSVTKFVIFNNLPLATVCGIIEVSEVIVGWSLGGVVGLGTLLFAFGIGPCVAISMSFLKFCFTDCSNDKAIE